MNEFSERLESLTEPLDYVNCTYFYSRLSDFDLMLPLPHIAKSNFLRAAEASTLKHFDSMEFE
jgi:hypothetical protein